MGRLVGASERAIYIHIPFCTRKCGYCDFNAYSGYKDGTKARYVDALCREIASTSTPADTVPTVFFGGGTPTNLPAADLARILNAVRDRYLLAPDVEISVEANPGDATPEYLTELRAAGFNRLSFGVQTFEDRLLKTIDRIHSGADARQAVAQAKAAGFDNISIDLMFALPRQTLADWDRSLDAAFALDIPHLSMYALIVEERTPFWARRERGKLPLPTEDTEAAMFARAIERATAVGYQHYEVSNYARLGYESRHNRVYWRNEEYIGFGAGAVSYLDGCRFRNEDLPSRYIERIAKGEPLTIWREQLSSEEALGETIMVGLRLREGLSLPSLSTRFGIDVAERYRETIARLIPAGLLEQDHERLRLTNQGLFFANDVMAEFLP